MRWVKLIRVGVGMNLRQERSTMPKLYFVVFIVIALSVYTAMHGFVYWRLASGLSLTSGQRLALKLLLVAGALTFIAGRIPQPPDPSLSFVIRRFALVGSPGHRPGGFPAGTDPFAAFPSPAPAPCPGGTGDRFFNIRLFNVERGARTGPAPSADPDARPGRRPGRIHHRAVVRPAPGQPDFGQAAAPHRGARQCFEARSDLRDRRRSGRGYLPRRRVLRNSGQSAGQAWGGGRHRQP